jgi:endonuclease IV
VGKWLSAAVRKLCCAMCFKPAMVQKGLAQVCGMVGRTFDNVACLTAVCQLQLVGICGDVCHVFCVTGRE